MVRGACLSVCKYLLDECAQVYIMDISFVKWKVVIWFHYFLLLDEWWYIVTVWSVGRVRLVTDTANVSGDQGWHGSDPPLVVQWILTLLSEHQVTDSSQCMSQLLIMTTLNIPASWSNFLHCQRSCLASLGGRSSYAEYQLYHHPYHSPALCFNFAYLIFSVSICLTKDK